MIHSKNRTFIVPLSKKGIDLKFYVSTIESNLIDWALSACNGNKNLASKLLKMNRTTLVEKLRKRGLIIPFAFGRKKKRS